MERLLVQAENNLKAAAQRQGLLAVFDREEMVWSLEEDDNATAINMAGGSLEVTPFTPLVDAFDNVVVQSRIFNRLLKMTPTDASGLGNDVISKAKAMCGYDDRRQGIPRPLGSVLPYLHRHLHRRLGEEC